MGLSRDWFQFIPTEVLTQQRRDEAARAWADGQRAQLAQEWTAARHAELAELVAAPRPPAPPR